MVSEITMGMINGALKKKKIVPRKKGYYSRA